MSTCRCSSGSRPQRAGPTSRGEGKSLSNTKLICSETLRRAAGELAACQRAENSGTQNSFTLHPRAWQVPHTGIPEAACRHRVRPVAKRKCALHKSPSAAHMRVARINGAARREARILWKRGLGRNDARENHLQGRGH